MTHTDEYLLSQYIVNSILEKGSGEDRDVCLIDRPRDKYFIGSLAPAVDGMFEEQSDIVSDSFFNKLSPTSMAIDGLFQPAAQSCTFEVDVRFHVYYRVYPTFDELMEQGKPELIEKFKKVPVSINGIRIPFTQKYGKITSSSDPALGERLSRAIAEVHDLIVRDPMAFKHKTKKKRFADVQTEEEYVDVIQSMDGETILPGWKPKLICEFKRHDLGPRMKLYLCNVSEDDRTERETDHYFFNCQITVHIEDGSFLPFELSMLPKDYRYDRRMYGLGQNCGVICSDDLRTLESTASPVFIQRRLVSNDTVKASFFQLSKEPLPVLKRIEEEMRKYEEEWHGFIAEASFDDSEMEACLTDLKHYSEEIERFSLGVSMIEQKPLIRKAFQLMNQTFYNIDQKRTRKFESWRLFQLVYIVMIIPDLATREYPELGSGSHGMDYVDVLWFPTGGGKTETYLGLAIFNAFFDRLRGKHAGVTSWIRFPLRLLSIQQLQRIADVYAAAELVRRQTAEIAAGESEPFSIGYFVGKQNTPNELNERMIMHWMDDPTIVEKYRIIQKCPFCHQESVIIDIEERVRRLVHKCTTDGCEGVLPLYVVDREIFRYLPTMIVGTVDKIASLGSQRRFAHIFGHANQKCKVHGYMSCGECTEDAKCIEPKEDVALYDAAPSLLIQDELHLLKESFGTFAAHYESLMDGLQQMINRSRAKVIAATATIEEYEQHVQHLYNRRPRRFPLPGYQLRRSFYARELDKPSRIFVGIMPHNRTHILAVQDLIGFFHQTIEEIRRDKQGFLQKMNFSQIKTEEQLERMLNYYETSLTYVNSRDDSSALERTIHGQLEGEMLANGYVHPLIVQSLTGQSSFKEIRDTIDRLEKPELYPDKERLNLIIATSLISHGVDIERFNYMVFYGIPRQVAEFIQSSSRVGRTHTGIVFVCFKPGRERDISYFHYFQKFIEYSDRLVEPVPINRWSKFSIEKTLPGIFMAIILQYYQPQIRHKLSKNMFFSDGIKEAILKGYIQLEDLIGRIKHIYGVRPDLTESEDFNKQVEIMTRKIWNAMKHPVEEKAPDELKRCLRFVPMDSLRDIDEEIEIFRDEASNHFQQRFSRRRRTR